MKMQKLLVVFGLLMALILTVNTVNGQPLNNGTNNPQMQSQSGTFTDCYSSFYSGMILLKVSQERDIDSEPALKQFFTDTCNFIHQETGKWSDLWNIDELKMLYDQVDINKFNSEYYPQGVPESVIDVFTGITAMAGAVGNGTDTTTEGENEDEGDD